MCNILTGYINSEGWREDTVLRILLYRKSW